MNALSKMLVAALALAPLAQSQNLIGFTANQTAPTSNISVQNLCNPPRTACANALPAPGADFAGGLTFDPKRESIWHTQGTRLQELRLDDCTAPCSTAAIRVLGSNSLASGLTMNHSANLMYQVESIPGWAAIVTYQFSPAARCPRNIAACRFQLPSPNHHAGAIAYDGKRDVVFVATSNFSGTAAPQNIIYVFRAGALCQPICRFTIDNCLTGGLRGIRAMAYEECKDVLYVSDGRQTSSRQVVWQQGCVVTRAFDCCALNSPLGELYYGFDVLPENQRRVGRPCVQGRCPTCPSTFSANYAVVGNANFGFNLDQAPTNASAYAFVSFSGCGQIPFLCGIFYPNLPVLGIGAINTGGGVGCTGSAFFPLPIPNDYNLCGLPLCAQSIYVCPAGGFGLTNATTVQIGS